MKVLDKIIQGVISGKKDKTIVLNDDGFLFGLFDRPDDGKRVLLKRILNLLLLLCCVITCFVILIKSFVFYINDVLLFENKVFMNQQGAFVPTQSCDREYALFMFTSSDWWANTGVQVQKGDRIKIMASGAFNSSISDLAKRVGSNDTLKYRWISAMPTKNTLKNWGIDQCIYRGRDAYWGAILYQIRNSLSFVPSEQDIRQVNPVNDTQEQFIEVDQNGTLFFAVNDIYLTSQIIARNELENRDFAGELVKHYGKDSVIINDSGVIVRREILERYRNKIPLFLYVDKDFAEISGERFRNYFEMYPTLWYDDNIGDILICMEIEHITENSYAKWYRECEAEFNSVEDKKNVGISEIINIIPNIMVWMGKAFYAFRYKFMIFLLLFVAVNFPYICRLIKTCFMRLVR